MDILYIVDIVDNANIVDLVAICGYSGTLIHALLYYVSGTLASLNIEHIVCCVHSVWIIQIPKKRWL